MSRSPSAVSGPRRKDPKGTCAPGLMPPAPYPKPPEPIVGSTNIMLFVTSIFAVFGDAESAENEEVGKCE